MPSMTLTWYINRLRKMGTVEVAKKLAEYSTIWLSRVKYRDPLKWPYKRFAKARSDMVIDPLPGDAGGFNHQAVRIFSESIDTTQPIDWQRSDHSNTRWPVQYWSTINYRPGNPFGDIRKNWELNRLQFLPHLSLTEPKIAISILKSWLQHNPYLYGPAYISSMEVALRWISIHRSVCLMNHYLDATLRKDVLGLAVASGKYILSRLSTRSSAGNHLIVEAVGLFWIGKALGRDSIGKRWCEKARRILWRQIPAQINPDGTGKEQSFWYLGFVLDAVFHYLLLEKRSQIPPDFLLLIERALEFIDATVLPNGTYFDFGDRDDGYVFRADEQYREPLFNGLLSIGSYYFDRPDWRKCRQGAIGRTHFWFSENSINSKSTCRPSEATAVVQSKPFLKTYPQGGMTLMKWARTQVLFRHAPLGLGKTCGHGHADALSVLMTVRGLPVLIDLGSGQYNGDQRIRNFFRSTIAHNTVELANRSQAQSAGPFLWKKPYSVKLLNTRSNRQMAVEARHDSYAKTIKTVHIRKVIWHLPDKLDVIDSFQGPGGVPMKGVFHLGPCQQVAIEQSTMIAEFCDFSFLIHYPKSFRLEVFSGSRTPFIGWRSDIYGKWNPNYSVVFSSILEENCSYQMKFIIAGQ